jgi:hypothetical protein
MANDSERQLPGSPPATVDYQAAPGPPGAQEVAPGAVCSVCGRADCWWATHPNDPYRTACKYLKAGPERCGAFLGARGGCGSPPEHVGDHTPPEAEPAQSGASPVQQMTARHPVVGSTPPPRSIRWLLEWAYVLKSAEGFLCTWCKQRNAHDPGCDVERALSVVPAGETPAQGWEDHVAEIPNDDPEGFPPGGPIQHFPAELDYVNAKLKEKHEDVPAGSFLGLFLCACLRADGANYSLLRPILAEIIKKYPAMRVILTAEQCDSPAGEGGA